MKQLPHSRTLTLANCWKVRYPSKSDAKKAVKYLQTQHGETQYTYKCWNCKEWHLTSKKVVKNK